MKGAPLEVLGGIKTTLTVAKEAVNGIPIVGTVAGVLLHLITVVEASEANKEQVKDISDRLLRLVEAVIQPILSAKQDRDSDVVVCSFKGISHELEDRIERLSIKLKPLRDDIMKIDSRGSIRRMIAHDAVSEALTAASKKIGEALDDFLVEGDVTKEMMIFDVQQSVTTGFEQTKERLDRVVDQISAEEVNRLIGVLPHAHAEFNAKSKGNTSSCWPGTRQQLLEEIYEWEADDGDDCLRVFWLTGLAGAGKTTIARTVASTLNDKGRLGASFLFSRLEGGDRAEADSLFTTIAWQLAQFHPSFRTTIAQSLKKQPESGRHNIMSQLKALITIPLSQIVDSKLRVTIVIDALDECSAEDPQKVTEILELLLGLPKFSFQLKFFLTSRPEYHIRDHLLSNAHVRPLILQRISPSIVQGDIELLLRESLRKVGRTRLHDEHWPSEWDLNALTKMSSELFIFASTAIKYIQGDRYRRNPKQNLETILRHQQGNEQSRPKGHQSPYHDIDQLYLQVLRGSVPEDADMEDSAFIRDIVGTIILLRRPLSTTALSHLIQVNVEEVVSNLELLLSVIDMPEDRDQPIVIIHPSFVDFLTSPERCPDLRFFVNRNAQERRLVERCLDHFNNSLSSMTVGESVESCVTLSELAKIPGRLDKTILALQHERGSRQKWHPVYMQYVCLFWYSHLVALGTVSDYNLTERLKHFGSTTLAKWVQHYVMMEPQLLGHLPYVITKRGTESRPITEFTMRICIGLIRREIQRVLSEIARCIPSVQELELHHSELAWLQLAAGGDNIFHATQENMDPLSTEDIVAKLMMARSCMN